MSIAIRVDRLTPDQVVTIRRSLSIRPMKVEVEWVQRKDGRGSFPKQKLVEDKEVLPVEFMRVQDGVIALPFAFGLKLLDCDPEPVPHLSETFDFCGTLRPHQEKIVEEALAHIQEKRSTGLYVYTGSGKTCMAAYLSACLPWMVLIIVHRTFLLEQWKNTFDSFTTASRKWLVGVEPVPETMPQVVVCMDGQIDKIPELWRMQIGTLILDEAHCLCTPSRVECLLTFRPEVVIACTATPERADYMHRMLHLLVGEETGVVRKSAQRLQVVQVLTQVVPVSINTEQGRLDWSALVASLSTDERRNAALLHLAIDLVRNQNRKLLILTSLTDHVKNLVRSLQAEGITADSMAGSKKKYKDGDVLVGTFSKISLAFDQQTASTDFDGRRLDTLILAISVKDLARLEQSVGRILRCPIDRNPTVYYFVDNHAAIRKHWNVCKTWFLKRDGAQTQDITTLEIDYQHEE